MTHRNGLESGYNSVHMEMETRTCLCGCGNAFRVAVTNKINYFDSLEHAMDALRNGAAEAFELLAYRRSKTPTRLRLVPPRV